MSIPIVTILLITAVILVAGLRSLPLARAMEFEDLAKKWAEAGDNDGAITAYIQAAAALRPYLRWKWLFCHDRRTTAYDIGNKLLFFSWMLLGEHGISYASTQTPERAIQILRHAIDSFSVAIKKHVRRHPKDFNEQASALLGIALLRIGEEERRMAPLEDAIAAFRTAQEGFHRGFRYIRSPIEWAAAQSYIGLALMRLAELDTGTKWANEAVQIQRELLQTYARPEYLQVRPFHISRERARAQSNLGNALLILGARKTGISQLEEAIRLFDEGLKQLREECSDPPSYATGRILEPLSVALVLHEGNFCFTEESYNLKSEIRRTIGIQGVALVLLAARTADTHLCLKGIEQITLALAELHEEAARDLRLRTFLATSPSSLGYRREVKTLTKQTKQLSKTLATSQDGSIHYEHRALWWTRQVSYFEKKLAWAQVVSNQVER